MSLKKYDSVLSFDLPADCDLIRQVDEDDKNIVNYAIGVGKSKDDEGNDRYECIVGMEKLSLSSYDAETFESGTCALHLSGDKDYRLVYTRKSKSILGMEVSAHGIIFPLVYKDTVYLFTNGQIIFGDTEDWLNAINTMLGAIRIEGKSLRLEKLTDRHLNEALAHADDDLPFPVATPESEQHTHLNFHAGMQSGLGFLGATINQAGTEYSFRPLVEEGDFDDDDDDEDEKVLRDVIAADRGGFGAAETAHQMAALFRVNEAVFDESEDREQEIENGLVKRCVTYNAFRSFAWTLGAYCRREKTSPEQVDFDTLEKIADFVVNTRESLNYHADSHCHTLCSGDDIHNYYIPDATPASLRRDMIETSRGAGESYEEAEEHVLSLDGLRRDLEYLLPAMKTLYNGLAKSRNLDKPLVGPAADVLYVYCSMTYAARAPIFTEDGPMNCIWSHPGYEATIRPFDKESDNPASPNAKPAPMDRKAKERELARRIDAMEEERERQRSNNAKAKEMLESISYARYEADRNFSQEAKKVERLLKQTFYSVYEVKCAVREGHRDAVMAALNLYSTCMELVKKLDSACRPYLKEGLEHDTICCIAQELGELNEAADIDWSFDFDLYGEELGNLGADAIRYKPTSEARAIESYWTSLRTRRSPVDWNEVLLQKYNVTKQELTRHQTYQRQIKKLEKVRSSKELCEIRDTLNTLGDYLDAELYLIQCEERLPAMQEQEAREEERRRQAEEEYREKYNAWLAKKADLTQKQKAEIRTETERVRKEKEEELKRWHQESEQALLQKEENAQNAKRDAETKLATLKFFQFSEKSLCKTRIEEAEQTLQTVRAQKEELAVSFNEKQRQMKRQLEEEEQEIRNKAEQKYHIPEAPKKPANLPPPTQSGGKQKKKKKH